MGEQERPGVSDGHVVLDLREEAHRLFGDMRSSTDEENRIYEEMLRHLGTPLPMMGIFSDGFGECDESVSIMGLIDEAIEGDGVPRASRGDED